MLTDMDRLYSGGLGGLIGYGYAIKRILEKPIATVIDDPQNIGEVISWYGIGRVALYATVGVVIGIAVKEIWSLIKRKFKILKVNGKG